jgi:hypothetical protein
VQEIDEDLCDAILAARSMTPVQIDLTPLLKDVKPWSPSRIRKITQAEISRACRAAPDRVVEVRVADGTVIRFIPQDAQGKRVFAKAKEIVLY